MMNPIDYNVQNHHQFFLNVRDFGAKGDGATDDTAAIQAAIDACRFPATSKLLTKRNSPCEGFAWGGTVFIPAGEYRTTAPLVLHRSMSIQGVEGTRPIIHSQADVAMVCWDGEWEGLAPDVKARSDMRCTGVTLQNLTLIGRKFGLHTMGVSAGGMLLNGCRFEGSEAGFASTGFFMGTVIERCQFHPSIWIIAMEGTRYNTSSMRNILIGLHGTRQEEWRMRLEGCIQCVKISEVCFEVAARAVLLDAKYAGGIINFDSIWSYDTAGPSEVFHIKNAGIGTTISNVLGTDEPSDFIIEENAGLVYLTNVRCKRIDAGGNRITTIGCRKVENPGKGSVIDGEKIE